MFLIYFEHLCMRYLLKSFIIVLSGIMMVKYFYCVSCPFSFSNHLMASPHLLIILVICIYFNTLISFGILSLICVPCHFHHHCTSSPTRYPFTHSVKGDLLFQRGVRGNLQRTYACVSTLYLIL